MNRTMAATTRTPRETAMAIIVAGDGLEEEEAAEETVLVVLEWEVILMAVVEKSEPVMARVVPGFGSCLQPACRARRTKRC